MFLKVCVELGKYLQTCSVKDHLSDDNLIKVAFEAAVFQRKESLMKLMLQSFQLAPKHTLEQPHQPSYQLRCYLIQEIGKLCQQAMYTEACLCVHHLKLHDMFDIHTFLLPLVLQDKLGIVEEFLEGCPSQSQQKELLKFLDSQFSVGSGSVYGNLLTYKMQHKVPDTKDDKLNHKPIGKLIKRFRTKYNLGFDCCPNIGRRQRFGELRHLFGRRYEKNEMSQESFNELVEQMAEEGGGEEEDKKMREDIINYFVEYGDFKEAARWISKFDMFWMSCSRYSAVSSWFPADKMPEDPKCEDDCWEDDNVWDGDSKNINHNLMSVAETVEKMDEGVVKEEDVELIGGTKSYFCHPFSPGFVYMITDPQQVIDVCALLDGVRRPNQLVSGFDSEWKPIMSKCAGAALVQVAFEDSIHIFDVISLKESIRKGYQGTCPWTALRKAYFENEKILKLGFDLRNDVKMLTETVTEWKGMSGTWRGMLDLSSLKNLILKECPHIFQRINQQRHVGKDGLSGNGGKGESGLSELVYLCLGKCLSKDEQMSDWEKRPLRDSQVQYAASDAYCLISVYRTLEKLCGENGVDLERIKDKYLKGCCGRGGVINGLGEGAIGGGGRKKKGAVEVVLELLEGRLGDPPDKMDKEGTGFVKLVVDNMLLGLGRYLRGLGFDTVMLENGRGHEDCVEYVKKGGRTIITRGVVASGKVNK